MEKPRVGNKKNGTLRPMALNDMQSEQVGSMISQALKADAPSKVLRNERVSSFRLNLKIHATNMLYDMRSECTIDGEVNMTRWQQIVGSVQEWDPATISKQTAILARDFPGISEQYRFSGIEYLRSVVGTVPGSFPDFDTFYGQYMRIVFEYPEVRTFEFFSRMHTGDRDAMFFEAFRRSLHTVLDSTKESSRWVQSQVEQPPQPPSVVRSAVSRKSRGGSVAASKAASHAPILPSDSASCMSSVMLASHHNQQSDSQILREIEGPEAAKTASVAQRAPSSRGAPRASSSKPHPARLPNRASQAFAEDLWFQRSPVDPSLRPAVRRSADDQRPFGTWIWVRRARVKDLLALRRFREPAHDLPLPRYRTDEESVARRTINSRFAFSRRPIPSPRRRVKSRSGESSRILLATSDTNSFLLYLPGTSWMVEANC